MTVAVKFFVPVPAARWRSWEKWLRKLALVAAEKARYNRRSPQGREGPQTRSIHTNKPRHQTNDVSWHVRMPPESVMQPDPFDCLMPGTRTGG